MAKAFTGDALLNKKFKTVPITGEWKDLIGTPELSGAWIIWGESGNGKTRLVLQMVKMLTQFGKVAYNTLEEGAKLSFQRAVRDSGLKGLGTKFMIIPGEDIAELTERLSKPKSPNIIVIDSIQYTSLEKRTYKKLINTFPRKLFIFISHAKGKEPKGSTAESIRYDADVKIWVEGYKAFAISRYGGGKPYSIWYEGAQEYWGNN